MVYLRKVKAAQDRGGWTSAERTRLSALRLKWERRAKGQDARFELFGTRPGRLTEPQMERVRRFQRLLDE